jgi:cell division protein FtsL
MVMPLIILVVIILAVAIFLLFLLATLQRKISSLDTELYNQQTKYEQDVQRYSKYITDCFVENIKP